MRVYLPLRICGDFKEVNQAIDTEKYPLPKITDIFASLGHGAHYSKLDLRDAYNQLVVEEGSRNLLVINTHKGLFRYTRLPFGVSSAPAIFQRVIENILRGLEGLAAYLDDCLIAGRTVPEQLIRLQAALKRLRIHGAKLKAEKCKFLKTDLEFLGHRLDAQGLHPTAAKVAAIREAPAPTSVDQLRSFLGLITYYHRFLPNMATRLAPLYRLLQDNTDWRWDAEERSAFEDIKNVLTSSTVLVHFDPSKSITLACDASPYGVGCVLSHCDESGADRPIAYASRTLTKAERNYAHIEKEALALIFGVGYFRDYLLGRRFALLTDHRPLTNLFSEHKPSSALAAGRILRWGLALAVYDYTIKYRKGSEHANADALSRCPLRTPDEEIPPVPAEVVLVLDVMQNGPVRVEDIRAATADDHSLRAVLRHVRQGWPAHVPRELQPFWTRRFELTVEDDVLLWGGRVVVPTMYRQPLLQELHSGHIGISAVKQLARSWMWWPGIDAQIETFVKSCSVCVQKQAMPASTTYVPWPETNEPWTRIHVDYAGPILGKMLLIIVDSHTKWVETIIISSATADNTAKALRTVFARYGIPKVLVSDNGPNFLGRPFEDFLKKNGVTHLTTSVYHPSSNGLAERMVRTVKQSLSKVTEGSLEDKLDKVLFTYRRAPLAATGKSPAEMMFSRKLRSRLDLILPEPKREKEAFLTNSKVHPYRPGDSVWCRNYGQGDKWLAGNVLANKGNAMLSIDTPVGTIVRHFHQLHKAIPPSTTEAQPTTNEQTPVPVSSESEHTEAGPIEEPMNFDQSASVATPITVSSEVRAPTSGGVAEKPPLARRSTRVRVQPKRLNL